nr:NAD(+) diphosphatase [Desulfomarina profundi]
MSSPFSLPHPFYSGSSPDSRPVTDEIWFSFHRKKLLIMRKNNCVKICKTNPLLLGIKTRFKQYIGAYGNTRIYIADLEDIPGKESYEITSLRSLYGRVDDELFALASRAIQIFHWYTNHLFCGRCGTRMRVRHHELAKICPSCNFTSFPRLSPAVIMSVIDEDRILLARSPHFPKGMYSTLAGFVEPGETFEGAVAREVKEEVGLDICNIHYEGSQPWPFPHSIMAAFSSSYKDGSIQMDERELEDAAWFSRDNLPHCRAG